MMRKLFLLIYILMCTTAVAQRQRVQNRPYTDLRQFHFGIVIGANMQDMDFDNVGLQSIPVEGGGTQDVLISADQDSWGLGFTVGLLGELRLGSHFALRVAPSMLFGNRHLTFLNHTELTPEGTNVRQTQDLKTIYVALPVEIIFASKRLNNVRPYLMAGINPMLNIAKKNTEILELKPADCFVEVGLGCDFYLPFFKLRPELKFMFSLTNALSASHVDRIEDTNLKKYATAVSGAQTKMIALSFYFE